MPEDPALKRAIGLAAALALWPGSGRAGCNASASGIVFGVHNPLSSMPRDAVGAVTLHCSADNAGAPFAITFSAGAGRYHKRTMTGESGVLPYQLYLDAGLSRIWGDGGSGTSLVQGVIPDMGSQTTYPVYGRIPVDKTVAPGSYSDLIVITVSY